MKRGDKPIDIIARELNFFTGGIIEAAGTGTEVGPDDGLGSIIRSSLIRGTLDLGVNSGRKSVISGDGVGTIRQGARGQKGRVTDGLVRRVVGNSNKGEGGHFGESTQYAPSHHDRTIGAPSFNQDPEIEGTAYYAPVTTIER